MHHDFRFSFSVCVLFTLPIPLNGEWTNTVATFLWAGLFVWFRKWLTGILLQKLQFPVRVCGVKIVVLISAFVSSNKDANFCVIGATGRNRLICWLLDGLPVSSRGYGLNFFWKRSGLLLFYRKNVLMVECILETFCQKSCKYRGMLYLATAQLANAGCGFIVVRRQ
jgi:hypothetical protein